jgi:hypothetical protein
MRLSIILLLFTVIFPLGCASSNVEVSETQKENATRRTPPPNLDEILSTGEPGYVIAWTYWHCEKTGALLEAMPAKGSWWWVIEPENINECELKKVSRAEFEKHDPRPKHPDDPM